jgi:RNA polymerase sigma-B factor
MSASIIQVPAAASRTAANVSVADDVGGGEGDGAGIGIVEATEPGPPPPPVRRWGPTGYEHLTPLFAERAVLPEDHPQRARLRAALIAGYLPVARNIARKHGYRGEYPEDLEQVASVGLILAVDRFDPGRDIDFLSFAIPTITGEVLRHFRDRATMIRIPRRLRTLQSQIYDAVAELAQRHGRAARPSEIARHLGLDVEDVLEGLAAQGVGHTSSLDAPARDGGGAAEGTRFADKLGHAEPEFDLVEHREGLAPLLATLPERERRILLLRFFGGQTQTEIAAQVGLSQMHVSRLLSRTLTRLRCALTAD